MRTERLRNEPGWIYIERPSFEVVPFQNSGTKNFSRNQLSLGLWVNVSYRLVRSACQIGLSEARNTKARSCDRAFVLNSYPTYGVTICIAWLPCGIAAIAAGYWPVGYGVAWLGDSEPVFGSRCEPVIELPR